MNASKIAFIMISTGVIFLTLSGLAIANIFPGGVGSIVLIIGATIILFLIMGMLLIYSGRTTAGASIIMVFSIISFLIGNLGISLITSYYSYSEYVYEMLSPWNTFIKGTFYIGIALLLIGGGLFLVRGGYGLARKQPASPQPKQMTDAERKIKRLEEYLEKLEELKKEGKISEKTYESLKKEYLSKIEETIMSG